MDNHNLHYKQVIQEMLKLQDGRPYNRDPTCMTTTRTRFPVYKGAVRARVNQRHRFSECNRYHALFPNIDSLLIYFVLYYVKPQDDVIPCPLGT